MTLILPWNESLQQTRHGTVTWTKRTYHRRQRQARLGRLAPIEYETMMSSAVILAA
ncbi:hypothetical protein [Kocuria rosea]|uniref:hypothetical protein n=1 Tax=Kocuria rosea TaxID=1275 RepID=UPI0025B78ACC|nr:hypothetical protein [Kocuria rosea]WJZ68322.1 hypothetical protein QR564_12010 [Kocuria rosea]